MGTCVIFCAAEFDALAQPIQKDDYILAADGGLRHLQTLGLTPNGILGDFDSLGYVPKGANVFPVEKDDTDSMLAVRRGLALGYRDFLIYGGLDGVRLDHTVANFQTLHFLCDRGARGYLVGETYLVTALKNGSLIFPAGSEGILSVFCLGADARGVTLEGLHYPLTEGTLTAGHPLGVSNHFTGEEATVTVKNGTLLLLWDRKNGFPRIREDGV
jgi:thiamine pyrophosphokinase